MVEQAGERDVRVVPGGEGSRRWTPPGARRRPEATRGRLDRLAGARSSAPRASPDPIRTPPRARPSRVGGQAGLRGGPRLPSGGSACRGTRRSARASRRARGAEPPHLAREHPRRMPRTALRSPPGPSRRGPAPPLRPGTTAALGRCPGLLPGARPPPAAPRRAGVDGTPRRRPPAGRHAPGHASRAPAPRNAPGPRGSGRRPRERLRVLRAQARGSAPGAGSRTRGRCRGSSRRIARGRGRDLRSPHPGSRGPRTRSRVGGTAAATRIASVFARR